MNLSVVIATKGRPDDLAQTLASLSEARPRPHEVLVVDGDPDHSAESVSNGTSLPGLIYVPGPAGLTLQRNVGLRTATGDVVVFLDDDVEIEPGLFAALASAYGDSGVVGATGRVVEAAPRRFGNKPSLARRLLLPGKEGTMTRFGYPRRLQATDAERDVEFMQGCLMSARRHVASRLGFDEALAGYALLEDEDFSYRLSRVGRIRYLPEAVVWHKNTGMRSSAVRAFNRDVVVNRTYLFRKNFERTVLTRLQFTGLLVVLLAHRVVNGEWAGVRGLIDGSVEAWKNRH
jgi:GT2 family glycosyltransferase